MSLKSEILTLTISNDDRTIDIPLFNLYNVILRNRIDAIGIHLELLIDDNTDIKSMLPIKGGEIIQLTVIDAHGNQIDKEFKIINYKNVNNNSDNINPLYLEAIEKEGFELLYTRKYQNFNNKKISEVLVDLLPKDSDIEETKNKINMSNPSWTINKFIQKLTDRAINKEDKISFLFYQDYDNFHFKSLDTIIDEASESVNDYVFDNYNPSYRYNVLDWRETTTPNYLDDQTHNITNNEYIAYNPDDKDFKKVEVKYNDVENTKLGKGNNQPKESLDRENKKVTIVDYYGEDDIENVIKNDTIFKSYNKKYELLCNFDINLKVGSLVNLLIPTKYDNTELNQVYAGKWLVSKVAHQFNLSTAHTKVEVIRNASYNDENKSVGKVVE